MFLFQKCQYPGCKASAVSQFDSSGHLMESCGFCLKHSPNPDETVESLKAYISSHDKIVGLNMEGINIEDMDLSGKKFYGCNFQHCTFNAVHSSDLRCRMCMFDFSTITECTFLKSNIQFSSFSGVKLVHTIFTGSDLIHNNFNGITAYQSSFDDSDLYNSRFIKAILINTSMSNCNLKKTAFYESAREGVSLKLSNTREALMDRSKGGMIGELGNSRNSGR